MVEKNPFYPTFGGFEAGADLSPLMLALLLVAGLVLILLPTFWARRNSSGRRFYHRRNHDGRKSAPIRFSQKLMHIPQYQLQVIAEARFETCPLLNVSEARLLPVLESAVTQYGHGHRVMAQTSVGELLRPLPEKERKDLTDAARAAINSKRFDFAIIDRSGRLVAAVEYQGTGHYARTAFMRDAVKREVCRKAGVAYIEVKKGMRPSELTDMLRDLLAPSRPVATAAE